MSSTTSFRWGEASVVLPGATLAVFLIGALCQLPQDWRPFGDFALVELAIRQIGHALLLVGPYSAHRGFNHPSPALYYLAWFPYMLSGARSSSLLAMTVAFNGVMLATAMWLATRRGGARLAVVLLALVTVFSVASGVPVFVMPWNPYLAAVPLLTLIVATWCLCRGQRWALPFAVGLTSWCVGNHLGFAPCAGGLLLVGVAGLLVTEIRGGEAWRQQLKLPATVSVGVGFVLWSPTLVDLAMHGRASNAVAIVGFLAHPTPKPVAPIEAVHVLMSELSFRPYWAGGPRPYSILGLSGASEPPLLLLVVGVAVALAWHRRATDELVGIGVALAALLFAFVGLLQVNDLNLVDWYLLPAQVAGVAVAVFTGWSLLETALWLLTRRSILAAADSPSPLIAFGCMVAVVALSVTIVANLAVPALIARSGQATAALMPAIERKIPKTRPVVLDSEALFDQSRPPALLLALDKAGYSVRVPPDQAYLFGRWRATTPPGRSTELYLRTVDTTTRPPEPGATLIASSAPVEFLGLGTAPTTLWLLAPRRSTPTRHRGLQ